MAKRQRSSFLFEPPPRAPWHRVLRNSVGSTSVDRLTWRLFSAENIRSAVQDLLVGCTAGVWLRILPLDEDDDSLCFHTGQEWADIQPCLQECGLLTTPGNIGGKLIAPTQVWEDFAVASAGVFEVGTFSRVADRLLKVLDLIVKDGGDNNLVESERGKLFSDPIDAPAEDVANDSDAPEAPDFVLDNEDE